MKRSKRDVLIEFVGLRLLTDAEADQLRASVIELKPKTHLVLANWRWLEARGIAEAKAAQLVEALNGMGLRFKVNQ